MIIIFIVFGDAPNEIWLVEGDPEVYYSKPAALTSSCFT